MGLRVKTEDLEVKLSHIGRMATGEDVAGTPLDLLEIARQHIRKHVVSMFRVLKKGSRPKLQSGWYTTIGRHRGKTWKDYRAKHHRKTTGQKPAAWGGADRMREFGFRGKIIGRARERVGMGSWKGGKYTPASAGGRRIRANTPMGGGERGSIAGGWGKREVRPRKGRGARTLRLRAAPGAEKKATFFHIRHPYAFVLKKEVAELRRRLQAALGTRVRTAVV